MVAPFDWTDSIITVQERHRMAGADPAAAPAVAQPGQQDAATGTASATPPVADAAPQGAPMPPASSSAQTPATPVDAPVDAPASPWDDAITAVGEREQAAARMANYQAHDTTPDAAARGLELQQQTGIPSTVAEANMPEAERRAALVQSNAVLARDPVLASWLAANPTAARVMRDDYDKLGFIGRTAQSLATGWTGGQLSYERGNIGNAAQLGLDTPEQQARVEAIDQHLQQAAGVDPGGFQGFTRKVAGFASTTLDNALSALSVGAATGGLGAAGGSLAGGVGAVPGAVAGFSYGAGTGFLVDMARNAAGNAYLDASKVRHADGQGLDEWTRQGAAVLTGVGTYVLGGMGANALGRSMAGLFQSAVREAVTRPTVARAIGQLGMEVAKGATTGAVVNGGMELSNVFAQQAARVLSSGQFDNVLNDPAQRAQAVDQLVSSIVDGAELFGAMHALPGAVRQIGRVQRSQADLAGFQALQQGATESATRGRAPSVFMSWLQHQTEGTPTENLFVPGEAVRSLYQDMGFEPGDPRGPLAFMPDLAQQMDQARTTGGDVVMPMADFVTHLAGTDVSTRLQPDLRVRQDGLSAREMQEMQAAATEARDSQARDAESAYAIEQAQREPVQTIHEDVFSQARKAGFSPDVAQRYAALWSARYATRAERLGINALDLFQRDNVSIRTDLPGSLQTAPATALDALIAGLRSTRRGPTERDLHGPSLMEFLARRGGVEDRGGDLAAMGAGEWHRGKPGMPRVLRPFEDKGSALPGMGGESSATRYGPDASTLAAWEAGYLPGTERPEIGALHEAVRQELSGKPVRAERNRNQRAIDHEAALSDLAETLDRLGIDPKTASNAEIRRALAGEGLGVDSGDTARRSFGRGVPDAEGEQLTRQAGQEEATPAAARPVETITRASLEASARTGREGEVDAEGMARGFHGPIAEAIRRGDQVVHVNGEGRETPLTSRDGRTRQASDDASVGWMGMLSNTADRVEIRPGAEGAADPHATTRSYLQRASEPVAKITGEEIAPATDDLKTLRTKAREFYDRELKGTSAFSTALGREVEFRSSRKAFSASGNPDKLRLFSALRDIIQHGTLENTTTPRDPLAESNTKAYHYLTATVELDGKPVRVGTMIREDNSGHLYYNHAVRRGAGGPAGYFCGYR